MSVSTAESSVSDEVRSIIGEVTDKKTKPEDDQVPDIIAKEKILSFDEASNCLNTLGKDESCMRYAYLRFTACDMKLTDIRTLLNFRHVLFVDVSGNFLEINALQPIAAMPFLVQLHAQRNFIDSCALKPMCYLQDLSLARNRIHDTIGMVQPSLEYLDLNYNQIYQIILPTMDLPCLKELEMRGNLLFEVSGKFPMSLEKLFLAENNITRFISDDISILTNLQVLHVRNNKIKKLDGFTPNLTNLKYLNLRKNNISKIRQFRKLQCLPALETLIILQNPVSADTGGQVKHDDYNTDEEMGEDREVVDPNRISILALLPNLKRINKTPVTYIERQRAEINQESLLNEIMSVESSDDENAEPPSTATTKSLVNEDDDNTIKSQEVSIDEESTND